MKLSTPAGHIKITAGDVIALAMMGRRAVLPTADPGYELYALRGGPRRAVDWANLSERASVMPRDTKGRFISLAHLEVTLVIVIDTR